MPGPLVIDTNLLVLFVVGTTSRDYIAKHKRLSAFVPEDYEALVRLIQAAAAVFVTPNSLAETSNLAAYIAEPARTQVLQTLRELILRSQETYIASTTAASRSEFLRLGLTDAALLEASADGATLLTTDLNLYLAAESAGKSAINFNQIRDQYLGPSVPR